MGFAFISAAAKSAWLAATTKTGQLEGLRDVWSGQAHLKHYSAGGTLLATVVHAKPVVRTDTWELVPGVYVSQTVWASGVPTYCVWAVPGGADIVRADSTWDAADPTISDPGGRVRLDIGTTLRVQATASLPAVDLPTWLNALTVDQWAEISGTNLSTAGVRQAQFVLGSGENPIDGWGGWAWDSTTLTAYLTGGGHTNGPDNSVYKIGVSANSPAWSRAADGSESADWVQFHTISGVTKYAGYNLDDKPTAPHVYHWIAFVGGKVVRYRYYQSYGSTVGTAMTISPLGQGWTNILNPSTGAWSLGALAPSWYSGDADGSGNPYFRNCVVNDGTLMYGLWQNRVYGDGSIRLMSYNVATDAYAVIGADQGSAPDTGYGGCLHDTARGEMVQIPENASTIQRYNLTTGTRTATALTGAQSGFSTGWSSSYMGACYDSARDLYYVYSGQATTGQTLYQIDPSNSYACTAVTTSGTPTATTVSGMNSRMVYIEEYDVILIQPAFNSGLWALKRS